jgi:tRNA G18 (ribose-2'-O)-methylase SpoU
LVPGGERSGVSPEVIEAADAAVAIPMLGMANSLNVATTAAILLGSVCDLKRVNGYDDYGCRFSDLASL